MQPSEPIPDKSHNLSNELAKERTSAAADRTLMAWTRTSLSLISFGFGIPTIVRTIEASRMGSHVNPHFFANVVGLSFIGIGMYAMVAGLQEHRQVLRQIRNDHYTYKSSNTAKTVGWTLTLVGLISFVGVLLRAMNL